MSSLVVEDSARETISRFRIDRMLDWMLLNNSKLLLLGDIDEAGSPTAFNRADFPAICSDLDLISREIKSDEVTQICSEIVKLISAENDESGRTPALILLVPHDII